MKATLRMILILVAAVSIDSCTKKETTPPSAAETNATLLAGAKGASKSWSLTSISETISGSSTQTVSATNGIPACESDNVFTFSNNAAQGYQQSEGSSSCTSGDPSTIESGSWAFTDDGKTLLIDAAVYPTSTQFQNEDGSGYFLFYFILSTGTPLTITKLDATSLTITYMGSYTDPDTNALVDYTDVLVFTAN